MSIINDAIKKARKEFEIENKAIQNDTLKKQRPAKTIPESSEIKWTAIITVSLMVIVSLLGSVLLYKHMSRPDETYDYAVLKTKRDFPSAVSGTHQKPTFFAAESEDVAELNGIVYGPKDKWAIIDNKIAREGDILLDGRVVLIAKDFVKIEKHTGEEILLELK